MSFASKVLIGLGLGILAGVVFGDLIAFVGIVGRGFVLSLQMAVLPFVSVSLLENRVGVDSSMLDLVG